MMRVHTTNSLIARSDSKVIMPEGELGRLELSSHFEVHYDNQHQNFAIFKVEIKRYRSTESQTTHENHSLREQRGSRSNKRIEAIQKADNLYKELVHPDKSTETNRGMPVTSMTA